MPYWVMFSNFFPTVSHFFHKYFQLFSKYFPSIFQIFLSILQILSWSWLFWTPFIHVPCPKQYISLLPFKGVLMLLNYKHCQFIPHSWPWPRQFILSKDNKKLVQLIARLPFASEYQQSSSASAIKYRFYFHSYHQ